MFSLLRRAWLTVVLAACAAPPSGVRPVPPPVTSALVTSAEPVTSAAPEPAQLPPCEQAAQLQARARASLLEGELYRTLRWLDQAAQLCAVAESRAWEVRAQALAELGRPEAGPLAERILRATEATDEARAGARAAQARLAQLQAPTVADDQGRALARSRQELAAAEKLVAQGQWARARERFEKAWAIGGQRWRALEGLARVAEHEGEKAAAQRLRERTTEELEREVRQPAEIALPTTLADAIAVAHAADGLHVAVSFQREVVVCAQNPLRRVRRFEVDEEVFALAFSPDGEWLAMLTTTRILVRNVVTAAEPPSLALEPFSVLGMLGWSADGLRLLAPTSEGVTGWDVRSGRKTLSFRRPASAVPWDRVGVVRLSPDGRFLAVLGLAGELELWSLPAGRLAGVAQVPGRGLGDLAFSLDGRSLAIVHGGALWELDTTKGQALREVAREGKLDKVSRLTRSPDGKTAAGVVGGEIHRWDMTTGRALTVLPTGKDHVGLLAWSADSQSLTFERGSSVRWLDVTTGKSEQAVANLAVVPRQVSWSPDGRSLATGSYDGWVRRWALQEERGPRRVGDHDEAISDVSWSADSRVVVASDFGGLVRRWDASTGTKLGEIKSPSPVRSMRVSPDGKWLAAGGEDGVVRIAALTADRWTHELHGHGDQGYARVYALDWSPGGRRLLSGSHASSALVWDVATGRLVQKLERVEMPVYSVAFSPDGRSMAIATANNHLMIWDGQGDAPRHTLDDHVPHRGAVSFDPAGRLLASVADETAVRLWDPVTGEQLAPLLGHRAAGVTLSWSPDGLLATGSEDGTVRIWSPTERRELLALMTLGQDSGSYVRAPSGEIALLGSEGQKITLARFAPCRVGTFLLPFAFCRGRFLADELLTNTLRDHLGRRRAR